MIGGHSKEYRWLGGISTDTQTNIDEPADAGYKTQAAAHGLFRRN